MRSGLKVSPLMSQSEKVCPAQGEEQNRVRVGLTPSGRQTFTWAFDPRTYIPTA